MPKERAIDRINRTMWELRQAGKLDKQGIRHPSIGLTKKKTPVTRVTRKRPQPTDPTQRCCKVLWPDKLPQSFRACPDCPLDKPAPEE